MHADRGERMHVAAKIGLAVAGGAATGFALEAFGPDHKSTTATNLSFLGIGIGGTAINARMLATSSTMPWLSTLGIAAGAMSASMAIGDMLFDSAPAKTGVRELAPGPVPSPAPSPRPTDELAGREHELVDPMRPDAGPSETGRVEEEVETYGPDGEYLGSEHGTLGG